MGRPSAAALAVAAPERLHGGLAVELLGGVGVGGTEAFEAEIFARTPEDARRRAEELDEKAMRAEGTQEDVNESMRLVWPAYFADPAHTLPWRDFAASVPAYSGLWESLKAELPRLSAALPAIRLPFGFLAGDRSPMPSNAAAGATAAAIPGAWFDLIVGAGHFPWFERPGCVRAALQRLIDG